MISFLNSVKVIKNVPQNIPYEILKIALEDVLYLQDVTIRNNTELQEGEILPKTTETYSFKGHSEISKHWFDIDLEWMEDNFMTREPELCKRLFQRNIESQYEKNFQHFQSFLGIQKKQATVMLQHWNINRMIQIVVVSLF